MATKYFVLNNPDIGRTYNWGDSNNWSLTSGGSGGAGVPTMNDDVIIDPASTDHGFPINQNVIINSFPGNAHVCRNLTISTGFAFSILYTQFSKLCVYGIMNLSGAPTININYNYSYPNYSNFVLLGSVQEITHVNTNNLSSVDGKRIYYKSSTCTITNSPFWQPTNTVTDPITGVVSDLYGPITVHIKTKLQLQNINSALDNNYILDNDINLSGVTWVPLGAAILGSDVGGGGGDGRIENPFTGTFNGSNHSINNLNCDVTSRHNELAGLFGSIGCARGDGRNISYIRVSIKNLSLRNVTLKGTYACGGLVGFIQSAIITNCHIYNVNITGNGNFASGGLGGDCYGWDNLPTNINNCTTGNINISGSGISSIGGLLGESLVASESGLGIDNFLVNTCFVNNVTIDGVNNSGSNNIGGLVGYSEGNFEKCYVTGSIINVNNDSGGMFGVVDFITIKDLYSHVNIAGDTDNSNTIGGFIGYIIYMVSNITNCYSSGTVTGDNNSDNLGGFIGVLSFNSDNDIFNLLNCYSAGVVSPNVGNNDNSNGGFIGYIQHNSETPVFSISNCWSYTGSFIYAIGIAYDGSLNQSMVSQGYGGDETDNTHFYTKTHPVYASGLPPIYATYLKDEAGNVLLDQQGNPLLQE